jgi:hypothetical protein
MTEIQMDGKTIAQTPGKTVEENKDTAIEPTQESKTFTQAELDAIVQDRLDREKKKYADYKDLKTAAEKLKKLEAEKLSDTEKAAKRLSEIEKVLSEKEAALSARDLRDKKRSALEGANLGLTEGWVLSDILDLMPGDEDSIPQEIEKWKKRFPAKKSLGTGTQTGGQSLKDPTLAEQISTINLALKDPKVSSKERRDLAKQLISLNRELMQRGT